MRRITNPCSLACLVLTVIMLGCDSEPEQAIVPTSIPEGAIEDGKRMAEVYRKSMDSMQLVPAN